MGLNKGYRTFRNDYVDNGEYLSTTMTSTFSPDFKNRHTLQYWKTPTSTLTIDYASIPYTVVETWVGNTLEERTMHEIYIVNNTASSKFMYFNPIYQFIDEHQPLPLLPELVPAQPAEFSTYRLIHVPANSSAHFYATAINQGGNLVLVVRGGSQDTR